MYKQVDSEVYFCPQCGAILTESQVERLGEPKICPRCLHDLGEEVEIIKFINGAIR